LSFACISMRSPTGNSCHSTVVTRRVTDKSHHVNVEMISSGASRVVGGRQRQCSAREMNSRSLSRRGDLGMTACGEARGGRLQAGAWQRIWQGLASSQPFEAGD
jgi:hypothetical protein